MKRFLKWFRKKEVPSTSSGTPKFTRKYEVALQILSDDKPIKEVVIAIHANSNEHAKQRASDKISLIVVRSRKLKPTPTNKK
jgi:hypothetical protein